MKKIILFTLLMLMVNSNSVYAAGLLSFGGEQVVEVINLPNDERYQLATGESVDIGYIYKSVEVIFIPIWNYDGYLVGKVGDKGEYINIPFDDLNSIIIESGHEFPEGPYLDFWHRIGGKIVFLLIFFFWGFKLVKKYQKKQKSNAYISALPTGRERLQDILINGQQFNVQQLAELEPSILEAEKGLDVEADTEVDPVTEAKSSTQVEGLEFLGFRDYWGSLVTVSILNMNKVSVEQVELNNDELFERLLAVAKSIPSKALSTVHYVYYTFDKSPSDEDIKRLKSLKKRKIKSGTNQIPCIIDFENKTVNLAQPFGALPSTKTLGNSFIRADKTQGLPAEDKT
ncbi:hypothetical protein GCM10008107_03580 [Psychrosphaera saromensis]|uniref:DUF3592 domain-containing protein n=1 Tax=Psychrosphaera saromensis TaxID=716813 RepID=A0A2S7UXP0_9GAMM|nr:hypothetical protein [Psychrosphaera saromensis]PQJ54693.1 hypothetical protein BTO11_14235 [Psychrosphaera saromensis]GHB57945.1 hypothetical protein GCM10008107_03580 [Psychrosphaera saromensis]GLQ14080.1 hypothetical protein GCM10007917_15350 [Psychrosphaera saromensis]